MRPLDRLPSIKLKLGVAIVVAVMGGSIASALGVRWGMPLWLGPALATAVALGLVQVLARGMTSPLREMSAAARAMARGDYATRVSATSQDEVGELARAFNAMAADLAEVDRLRRDLVANVSHELRTPIGSLRAALENIVDGVERPDAHTMKAMLRQAERLSRLVTQLLDLSRLEAGTMPLEVERFRLAGLLRAAAEECRLHSPSVEVEVNVEPTDLAIEGDPERLHQVLSNLLENAARYSPPQGCVRLGARRNGTGVLVEVCDDGPGIPPEQAHRVFERFHRADEARSSSSGGAGLGLAIARWIVELHGGRIHAERGEGDRGTRMVVSLPGAVR